MSRKLEIRESRRDDSAAIESIYPEAFPDENLLSLVRDLLNDVAVAISLVATIGTRIVGHVIFTKYGVAVAKFGRNYDGMCGKTVRTPAVASASPVGSLKRKISKRFLLPAAAFACYLDQSHVPSGAANSREDDVRNKTQIRLGE